MVYITYTAFTLCTYIFICVAHTSLAERPQDIKIGRETVRTSFEYCEDCISDRIINWASKTARANHGVHWSALLPRRWHDSPTHVTTTRTEFSNTAASCLRMRRPGARGITIDTLGNNSSSAALRNHQVAARGKRQLLRVLC